eukprot:GDKH01003699.1.p3 GENE.GDKH01003699.1~~GDKH01003699.1.p3  ORF type:complete len:61 (-),score=11.40 GDKH01003699.1:135-317(-)
MGGPGGAASTARPVAQFDVLYDASVSDAMACADVLGAGRVGSFRHRAACVGQLGTASLWR